MANMITSCRLICSALMLLFPAFSPTFYILYLTAGFTDMIDGTIARKTNTVSEFGSRLDTTADFVFVVICAIKMLPMMDIPTWLWIWIGIITLIKLVNIASGFIIQKKFVAEHTTMNRVTGILLFVFPLTLTFVELMYSATIICAVATFAAIQEGHYIRTERYI
ncbi:MAG: CDP-alcohol phosphatidyltransferase family protein [Lysinibacillus sp.]